MSKKRIHFKGGTSEINLIYCILTKFCNRNFVITEFIIKLINY